MLEDWSEDTVFSLLARIRLLLLPVGTWSIAAPSFAVTVGGADEETEETERMRGFGTKEGLAAVGLLFVLLLLHHRDYVGRRLPSCSDAGH